MRNVKQCLRTHTFCCNGFFDEVMSTTSTFKTSFSVGGSFAVNWTSFHLRSAFFIISCKSNHRLISRASYSKIHTCLDIYHLTWDSMHATLVFSSSPLKMKHTRGLMLYFPWRPLTARTITTSKPPSAWGVLTGAIGIVCVCVSLQKLHRPSSKLWDSQ